MSEANPNRQWALPSKPGRGSGKRSSKKIINPSVVPSVSSDKNSPVARSGSDSPSFTNARAMFEAKSQVEGNSTTKLPSPPKKRKSPKKNIPYTQKTDHASSSSATQPPPSMTGNEYTPNTSNTYDTQPKPNSVAVPVPVPDVPPMEDHRQEPLTTIIEDVDKNVVSPPPSMTGATYANQRPPSAEQKSSQNQRFIPPNVAMSPKRGYNANQGYGSPRTANQNPRAPQNTGSPVHNRGGSGSFNQRGYHGSPPNHSWQHQTNSNPNQRGGYPPNVNTRYDTNQYNSGSVPNRYSNSSNYSPHSTHVQSPVHNRGGSGNFNPHSTQSPVHNRGSRGSGGSGSFNQHNRVHSGSFNQHNRNQPHNRVNSGSFNRNGPYNTQNNGYPPDNPPITNPNRGHSRKSTNNMGHNIEWNYGGNKQGNTPLNTNPIHHPHPVSTTPGGGGTDDEYWFYVDPFKMKVSDTPVNKYVLKEMFINQHINENCLIWNELYADYVTIGDVPHLLNFFYDDTTDSRQQKYHHASITPKPVTKNNANAKAKKQSNRLAIKNSDGDDDDDPNNWKACYTADDKVYYKNLVNGQIVWTKPRALRGSVMKILLNDESIKNFKKKASGSGGKNKGGREGGKKRVSKREQKEINDFDENVGDVRWIPHSKDGYVIAQFVKRDGKYSIYQPFDDSELFESPNANNAANKDKKKRKPIKIPTLKVKKGAVSITNWDYMDKNVPDMVELPDLSAPYVLHNLKHRFLHQQIYTQVGEIMISINPYQLLPLYLPSVLEKYKYKQALAPHIYDIARDCYFNIISRRRPQSIIISGESGSGKTECTKQILQFIAECAGNENKIEQKLLSTNPILESFGNCLTVRNNNSSRFGKYIEIYFNDTTVSNNFIKNRNINQIVKSFQTIYLLEKVRVCKKSKEERNYHIFYQLIQCEDMGLKKSLKLGKVSNYAYLQGIEHAPGIADGDDFVHLNKAFKDIGCFADDAHKNTVFNIYRICSGILWLGNILFETGAKKSNDFKGDSCVISSRSENAVRIVCHLFQIDDVNLLSDALMYKSVVFKLNRNNENEITKMNLSKNKAYENRDALAKFLYNELFNWIVNKLNEYLVDKEMAQANDNNKNNDNARSIVLGVLDIFGFEILKKNSFEQLCINYTNERLQYLFDETVFRNEDALYESEGIKVLKNEKFNNLPIIQLVDAKKTGIFSILDAQCSVPQSDDTAFMIILNQIHDRPPSQAAPIPKVYEKFPKKTNNFIIHHYAGKVQYDARQFMNKNRDNLNMDLLRLLERSQNELIRSVIAPTHTLLKQNQSKTRQTLSQLYRESLNILISKLSSNQNESHYIRCIKPNDTKQQNHWMGKLVLDQLTYSGVFEAIKIKKNGYPFRGYHREFIDRFISILDDDVKRTANQFIKQNKIRQCAEMISNYLLEKDASDHAFKMGKTMVFYQQKEHQIMERRRDVAFKGNVDIIERYYRMYRARVDFLKMRDIKPKLQEAIRRRNINLLNSALSDAIGIRFPMRLIVEAKNLRALMDKEKHCEQQLQYVMNNKNKLKGKNPREYVQDLSQSIAECEAIGYYSDRVLAAKRRLEEFTSQSKIRQGLRRGIDEFDGDILNEYLEMTSFVGLESDAEIVLEAQRALKIVNREHDLIAALQTSFASGGYYSQNQVIDYSAAASISVDGITDALTKVTQQRHSLQTRTGKLALRRSRHLMQLRIALKKALLARNDDELWNIVVDVINKAILKDMPSMASNVEIEAANNLIYIYFREQFSDKFAIRLQDGMDRMDYAQIKSQIATLHGANHTTNQFELNKKYDALLQRGRDLVAQMEAINQYLSEGLSDRNMNLLSIGLARANDISYTDHDLYVRAHSFYSKYGTFDVRLNSAIYEFDVDAMKLLLEESESYENRKNDAKIIQIRNLIYNTPFDKLLQLQLNAAVSARDPEKVCRITLKLKKLFFQKNAGRFDWISYPKLLTPETWAKSGRLFSKKGKLKKTFYIWSDTPIHHSLTDLNLDENHNNVSYLKKSALEMFRAILGIMGDRHWEQPLSMIQDILIKISDFIPLRNEFYAQIIKQLTKNPGRESRIKGWNLMTVVLDTLKPPKDIENYLEKWLRDNEPDNTSEADAGDKEFYVRLLHQTIFLGSRTKIPTLTQINDLFLNKNVRSLKMKNNKKKPPAPSLQHGHHPRHHSHPHHEAHVQKQSQEPAANANKPPKLTSVHEGKLEKQRIALQWNRTIHNTHNRSDANEPGPGSVHGGDEVVYYCGYTMDDETRPGNNWHYAPHQAGHPHPHFPNYRSHHHNHNHNNFYNQHQPGSGQPGAAIPYSVTDQARAYRLDL